MSRLIFTLGGGLMASMAFVAWDMHTDAEMINEARLAASHLSDDGSPVECGGTQWTGGFVNAATPDCLLQTF